MQCSRNALLPALCYIAECAKGNFDEEKIKAKFKRVVGVDFDSFVKADLPNLLIGDEPNYCESPCKYMLYSDPFNGFLDYTVSEGGDVRYDEMSEKEAAELLISNKCVLISQHADSWGAPTACETAGVPNVSYNGSTVSACPNTFIISSRINWEPYFKYMIESVINGTEIADDWCGGIAEGSVELSEINENAAAAGTAEKLEEVKAGLADGSIKVFDSATFTVNGAPVDSHIVEDTNEVISDGYFHESEYRSAPYFDIDIDGITTK